MAGLKSDTLVPITANKSVGILGVTDASSANAGDVGEIIEYVGTSDFTQSSPTVTTYYDVTSATINLTKGDWQIDVFGYLLCAISSPGAGKIPVTQLALRTAANSVLMVVGHGPGQLIGATSAPDTILGSVCYSVHQNISTNTTYKLSIRYIDLNNASTVGSIAIKTSAASYADQFYVRAKRIR